MLGPNVCETIGVNDGEVAEVCSPVDFSRYAGDLNCDPGRLIY